jgi:ClpP class serine protease
MTTEIQKEYSSVKAEMEKRHEKWVEREKRHRQISDTKSVRDTRGAHWIESKKG